MEGWYCYACFTSGGTEIQSGRVTSLRSHGKLMADPGLKLRSLNSLALFLLNVTYMIDMVDRPLKFLRYM